MRNHANRKYCRAMAPAEQNRTSSLAVRPTCTTFAAIRGDDSRTVCRVQPLRLQEESPGNTEHSTS